MGERARAIAESRYAFEHAVELYHRLVAAELAS
jgi:hypothetical protein